MKVPQYVPVFIPIARERAASFRRAAELFCSIDYRSEWGDVGMIVRGWVRDSMYLVDPSEIDVSLVLQHALIWARQNTAVPGDSLHHARELLEAMLEDWHEGWKTLAKHLKESGNALHDNHWFREVATVALGRERQLEKSLAEEWPVSSRQDENKRREEIKEGNFLELDEAFAEIAGSSKEEWLAKVRTYQDKRTRSGD